MAGISTNILYWQNGQPPARKASSHSDYVVKSPYPDIQLPTDDIYSLISKSFSLQGSRIALINGISGKEYSYNEIAETTIKFASGLQHLSYSKGDVLAIVLPNMPQYATVYLGALAAGGVVTMCNPTFTAEQLAYQFKNSSAKIVVTCPSILPTVQEATAKSGAAKIIVVDETHVYTNKIKNNYCVSYQSLVAGSGSQFDAITTKPDDVRVLAYTSATTLPGIPKGCMLTNKSVSANIQQIIHPELFDLRDTSKVTLAVAPFFHSLVITLLAPLFAGTKVVILPQFEPHTFFTTIKQYGVNFSLLLPPVLRFMAKDPVVDNYTITTLTDIQTGAAPIGKDTMKAAGQRLHCKLVRKNYGLTETSPITHIMPQSLGMQEADSIGCCIQNMKAKVVDLESGRPLPPNMQGEVWLKGPNVMKGYLNNTRATQECLTEDGWFKTGDIGKLICRQPQDVRFHCIIGDDHDHGPLDLDHLPHYQPLAWNSHSYKGVVMVKNR